MYYYKESNLGPPLTISFPAFSSNALKFLTNAFAKRIKF